LYNSLFKMFLKEVLKFCRVSMHFKCSGRLIHSFTALNKKDCWAVAVLQKGISNMFLCLVVRSCMTYLCLSSHWFHVISEEKYLKNVCTNLKCIRRFSNIPTFTVLWCLYYFDLFYSYSKSCNVHFCNFVLNVACSRTG